MQGEAKLPVTPGTDWSVDILGTMAITCPHGKVLGVSPKSEAFLAD